MLLDILWGFQAAVAVLLVICVLLQAKGQGMSMAFGGTSTVYRTRRGADKLIFYATIVLGALFALTSLVIVMLSQ